MTNLSDINKTLVSQNQNLEGIDFSIDKLSGNINKLIDNLTGLDNLEKERKKNQEKADKAKESAESKSGSGGGVGGFASGKPDFGRMFSAGGLLGAGAALGGFLLKRGLPALILNSLADNIADYIEGETGSKELGDALYRGIKLGSIGLLLGKRFGLIGAAIGVLLTDENKKKLEEMGTNFGKLKTKFETMFDISLPNADEIITGITTTFGEAIDGINAALTGDWDGITENVGSLALTVAGLFALFRPGKAIALAIAALTLPFTKAKAGLAAIAANRAGRPSPSAADLAEMRNPKNFKAPDVGDALAQRSAQLGRGLTDAEQKAIRDKVAAEVAAREAAEKAAKEAASKGILKKLPLFSIIAGGAFAYERATAGDYGGAGAEILSGILGTIPGPGTAASLAIDATLLGRDLKALENSTVSASAAALAQLKKTPGLGKTFEEQGVEAAVKLVEENYGGKRKEELLNLIKQASSSAGGGRISAGAPPTSGATLNSVATESQALSKQPIVIQDNSSKTNVGGGTTNQAIAMPPPNPFDYGDPFNGSRGLVISP